MLSRTGLQNFPIAGGMEELMIHVTTRANKFIAERGGHVTLYAQTLSG
jgi:hypothetical protein